MSLLRSLARLLACALAMLFVFVFVLAAVGHFTSFNRAFSVGVAGFCAMGVLALFYRAPIHTFRWRRSVVRRGSALDDANEP